MNMDERYAVSVIIPVYNTEKYLRECLDSVCREADFPQYEVLLVDDGSTDGSVKIIREYAARYPNIFLLAYAEPPVNRGVASARNLGLRHARGQYVFFLDSDDMVQGQYIGRLYKKIVQTQCDIVYAGYSRMTGKRIAPVQRPVLEEDCIVAGRDFLNRRMDCRDSDNYCFCALYDWNLFTEKSVAFEDSLRLYEDIPFAVLAACSARRVCTVPLYDYLYRCHAGSLVQSVIRWRDVEGMMDVLNVLFNGADPRYLADPAGIRVSYQAISMCLYYLGVLADEKRIQPDQQRQIHKRLHAMIPWGKIFRAAASPRERVKWWIWRIAPAWFFPIVHKPNREEMKTE